MVVGADQQNKINHITDMLGIDAQTARVVLSRNDWDIERAAQNYLDNSEAYDPMLP